MAVAVRLAMGECEAMGREGMERVEFLAAIPDIASALKVSGEGAGRLCLDMDETQLPAVLKLIAFYRGKLLRVTVEEV